MQYRLKKIHWHTTSSMQTIPELFLSCYLEILSQSGQVHNQWLLLCLCGMNHAHTAFQNLKCYAVQNENIVKNLKQ